MNGRPKTITHGIVLVLVWLLATCSGPSEIGQEAGLRVVATTTIIGDVVGAIGGEAIELRVLLPPGADPHSFEPTPQDAAAVARADVVFGNGLGLETFLASLLEDTGADTPVISLSDGIQPRQMEEGHEPGGEEHEGGVDPHVWLDPLNVVQWAHRIESTLSELDPPHAAGYAARATQYEGALHELHGWIQDQVAQIPADRRLLVTDHAVLGYMADRYGFRQVGALIPSFSSLAEPSARDIAALEQTIAELNVPAIFVSTSANPDLAQRLAEDAAIRVIRLYTGSLSDPDGPAGSYLDLMRYDVSAIVEALR